MSGRRDNDDVKPPPLTSPETVPTEADIAEITRIGEAAARAVAETDERERQEREQEKGGE